MFEAIIISVCLFIAIVYGLLLFELGKSKDRTLLFFILAYVPVIAEIFALFNAFGFVFTLTLLQNFWIVFLFIFIERIFYGIFLKESAEYDEPVWFFIILIVPLFGWILFKATRGK